MRAELGTAPRRRRRSELHEQVEQTRKASDVRQTSAALERGDGFARASELLGELRLRESESLPQVGEIATEKRSKRGAIAFVHGSDPNGSRTC